MNNNIRKRGMPGKNKTVIRLTESKLRKLIKQCVCEAQEKWWRGVPNVRMIWHGDYADPELVYNGVIASYYDIEDTLYEDFKEETGYKTSDDEEETDEAFDNWLSDNKYRVYELFDSYKTKEEEEEDDYTDESRKRRSPKRAVKLTEARLRNIVRRELDKKIRQTKHIR